MIFDIPTKEECKKLLEEYPFDESILAEDNFRYTIFPEGGIESLHAGSQISTWHLHLVNRMYQTRFSWIQLNHLFNKGIPDDEWFISPGSGGVSVEFFPHFKDEDFSIKAQFDYFSDIFYYKLFSAWDNLGHILNHMFGLEIKKADLRKAVTGLKAVRPDLYSNLNDLIDSDEFKKMCRFRHSSTHNELIGQIGHGVTRVSERRYTFGVGGYDTSAQIKGNADDSLRLFARAVEFIKEQVGKETP